MDVLYFRAKATSLPRFEYHRNAKKWPAFVCFWKKWLVEISKEMMKCRAARRIFMIDISWSSFRWFNIESISKSQGWDLPIWWLARFLHSTALSSLWWLAACSFWLSILQCINEMIPTSNSLFMNALMSFLPNSRKFSYYIHRNAVATGVAIFRHYRSFAVALPWIWMGIDRIGAAAILSTIATRYGGSLDGRYIPEDAFPTEIVPF